MHSQSEEIIEVWDWETARPTGKPAGRREAHRLGIPHEGVHLWIVSTEAGEPELLFQFRAAHKEHYPDCLDITVGGHVPFGLAHGKIQKEAEEEIGIIPGDEDLTDLGYCRYEERSENIYHREFQHVYLLLDSRPLTEYRFNDREVTGIYAVPVSRLKALFTEDMSFTVRGFDGTSIVQKRVSRKDFHPQLFDESMRIYMEVVIGASMEIAMCRHITLHMPDPVRRG